jgi:short-subunit dehydrogenase
VASIAGFQPVPFMAVYGAAKAFVLSFSQGLWAEVRPLGVGVVAVCPGPVATKFMEAVGTTDATVGSARTPEQVVSATLRTLDRGGSMVTPGLPNAALHLINRLLPRRVVLAVGGRRMAVPPSAPAPAPAS